MFAFPQLALYGCLLAMVGATPVALPRPDTTGIIKRVDIEPIKQAFRGIHWDDALTQCTTEQFNILAESTRMALELTNFNIGTQEYDGPAWHRNFVRDWMTNPNFGWHVS